MDESNTDLLSKLMAAKRDCLARLLTAAQHQQTLIAAGDMEHLLVLLAGKQRLLGELGEVERQLDPFRHQAPGDRRWRSAEQRALTAQHVKDCEALLGQLLEHERRGEREILEQRDEAARRLQSLSAATTAHGAYAATTQITSGHLDLFSEV